MPKRSNDFQKLILLIERQLAPRGARVSESHVIRDTREAIPRELDVAVEIPVGARTLLVAIECVDHKRKTDVQWIDKMVGKYRDLPVSKVIAVSRSGFTAAARHKAALHNIDAISFSDAEKIDWATSIGTPVLVEYQHIQVRPRTISYHVDTSFDFTDWPPEVIAEARLITVDNVDLGSILDIRRQIQDAPGPRDEAIAALDKLGEIRAVVRGDLPSGTRMRFADGRECVLRSIDVELIYARKDVSIPLEHIRYGEAHVAHAESNRDGHQMQIAVVRLGDGNVRGAVSVKACDGRTLTILGDGKELARLDERKTQSDADHGRGED
jgi:hypothetical protein